jgi:hypothetical protein
MQATIAPDAGSNWRWPTMAKPPVVFEKKLKFL